MTPYWRAQEQVAGYLEAIARDGERIEHLQSLAYWRAVIALLEKSEPILLSTESEAA